MKPLATHHSSLRTAPSLGWFVSLSLLLHLGLLWGIHSTPIPIQTGAERQQSASLSVRIARPKQPQPTEPQATAVHRRAVTTHTAIQKKFQPKQHHTDEKSPSPITTDPPVEQIETPQTATGSKAPATVTAQRSDTEHQEHLKVSLQQALAENFRYPLLARRRGWQGEVLLAFRVETDGRISDARIARSSGYGVLDNAALDALSRVKHLHHGLRQSLTLQLPVIYRLEG